jgi:hypothetical protein
MSLFPSLEEQQTADEQPHRDANRNHEQSMKAQVAIDLDEYTQTEAPEADQRLLLHLFTAQTAQSTAAHVMWQERDLCKHPRRIFRQATQEFAPHIQR